MRGIKRAVMTMLLGMTVGAAALPDYQTLCSALAEMPGWTAEEKCDGMKMAGPMGEIVTATRIFRQGDATLEVAVMSGMQAAMAWSTFATGVEMESDEALMKTRKMGEFNVGISYDKKEHSGGIVVRLASNAVLVGSFENMEWEKALEALKSLDWEKLAALFR